MPLLKLENLSKRYNDLWALREIELEAQQGEIFGLLGPSGSGKTTTLRIIAGLETPTSGKVIFNNQDFTEVAPENRDFAMVFQNYSLFPHLNVFENVAFGLKARKFAAADIAEKVSEALELVRLKGVEERRVSELSGGQQQRLAIARSVVTKPQLLLFDEPFSNLDVSLREETRSELRDLIKNLNLTAIYVTHDQDEAFALCDRIAILAEGKLLQTDTPRVLYEKPNQVAVARFLGKNNLIQAARLSSNKTVMPEFQTVIGQHRLFVDRAEGQNNVALGSINQIVTLAIRPENIILPFGAAFPEDNLLKAKVKDIQYFGATTRIKLDANNLEIEALVLRLVGLNIGDDCLVSLPPNRIMILKD